MNQPFDLDALGPDWQLAYRHGIASLPGLPLSKDQANSEFCPCCNNQICEQDVPLCQNSKTLQFLGYGFPLYFIFIKFSLILISLLLITYTSNGIYWANKNNRAFCSYEEEKTLPNGVVVQCTSWMIMLARVEATLSEDEKLTRVTSFAVTLLILLYMRDILRKTSQYYDQKEISPSDFSILVQNLPKTKGIAKKIKSFLKNKSIFRKSYEIQAIVFISSLDKYFQLKKKKKQLVQKLKNLLQLELKNPQQTGLIVEIKNVEEQIRQTKAALTHQEQLQTELMKNDEALCQKLILIINTQKEKNEIIQDFESAQLEKAVEYFGEQGREIKFKEAPEPKEILWENINYSKAQQAKRVFISWVIYVSILSIVTVVFFFFLSFKAFQVEHSGHQIGLGIDILVISCLFSVLIFNKFVLSLVSHKLTQYQKQKTGGEMEFSFALKQILGLFFTTALMTLLVEDLRFNNIYTHSYGVIEQESIIFIMNGFIAPLIWIINPWHIYKTLKKNYFYGSKLITQDEANKLMQLTHYSIGKRYAEIIEGIWFTFLYSSVIPIGSFFNLFGLAMFYWIDKYNLLRKSSVLQNVSSDICLQAMTFLDFSLVLKPLGQIIFDSQIRESTSSGSYICLVLGVIYMLLPINRILDYVHPENFDLADETYSETKDNFIFDYKTLHPLKYCLEKERVKQVDFDQEVKQQVKILKPNMLSSTGGLKNSRSSLLRKQILFNHCKRKFQQIHSRDQKDCSEAVMSANRMVKQVRELPPLNPIKDARKWERNKLFL